MPNELVDRLSLWGERRPTSPAVEFDGRSLSYRELDLASSAVASTLLNLGVEPGDVVAVWLRKSIEAVVAIYATLKCAAAYVPIDPSAPLERARRILADCAPSCVIANADVVDQLRGDPGLIPPHEIISVGGGDDGARPGETSWRDALGADPARGSAVEVELGSPAYVLYTSGSTGAPKGVTLSHGNALAFVDWAVDEFAMRETDRVASHAPFQFDLSILDLFATSRSGGCLSLIPESQVGFGAALNAFVADSAITMWYSVPSALIRALGAANREVLATSALRTVLFAGEVFPPKHLSALRLLLPSVDLYNLYGPTETNVCTFHRVDSEFGAALTEPAPIGRPCPYAKTFLLDRRGAVLEHRPGVEGELCVAGDSVMLGYWGDPALTAAKTVTIPQPGGPPLPAYRTGDLVRVGDDLNYVFCGREDDMVKVRGHRVELGEIEAAIGGADDVDEVACVALPDGGGDKRIAAFVVPASERCEAGAIRRHCLTKLPRYMVPDAFHLVRTLPRTVNGKVDRGALSELERGEAAGDDDAGLDGDVAK